MKKETIKLYILILFLSLFLIIPITNISCQDVTPDTSNSSNDYSENLKSNVGDINPDTGLPKEYDKITDLGEKLTDDKKRTEYFNSEFKNFLLKNKAIASIDKGLNQISIIFYILFGMKYELTLTFFLVMILWIIVFVKIAEGIHNAFDTNEAVSLGISFAVCIILGQLNLFYIIVDMTLNQILSAESLWGKLFTIIVAIIIFVIFYYIFSLINDILKSSREKREKEKEKDNRKILTTTARAITKD